MSFDKNYPNRKDWRKQYNDGRAVDATCRSHGNCPACAIARKVKAKRKELPLDSPEGVE